MPSFRWPEIQHDISLAKEYISKRPKRVADWDLIASTLNEVFSTDSRPVCLKGRGCRERINRLVEKYRSEEKRSLKRYGCIVTKIAGMSTINNVDLEQKKSTLSCHNFSKMFQRT